MDFVVDGNVFNTKTDIVPGELDFDNVYLLSNEDFIKTMELDKDTVSEINSGGDTSEE